MVDSMIPPPGSHFHYGGQPQWAEICPHQTVKTAMGDKGKKKKTTTKGLLSCGLPLAVKNPPAMQETGL